MTSSYPFAPFARKLALFAAAALGSVTLLEASDIGRRLPSEKTSFVDRTTGVPITVLTTDPASDSRIYQTHPQWTFDQKYIIFRSSRGATDAEGKAFQKAFAVNEVTGEIVQLTDDKNTDVGTINISRLENKLWYTKRAGEGKWQIVEMDLDRLLKDSEAGTSTDHEQVDYERVVAAFPEGLSPSGGFGMDVDEKTAYVGVNRDDAPITEEAPEGQHWRIKQTPGGIRALDIASGQWRTVVDVPFKMGHVQTNPWVAGEIVYCHETGGDAVQRMWTVQADGSGNRPLFKEGPTDWVTHEVVIDPDTVLFVLIGFSAELRSNPTGMATINLRNGMVELVDEVTENVPEGMPIGTGGPSGYWHCNGSPDGKWIAGDTFAGSLYLVNRHSGEKTLLTTGHLMKPDHIHPSFSPDSKRIVIQSGYLSDGKSLDVMVVNVPQDDS